MRTIEPGKSGKCEGISGMEGRVEVLEGKELGEVLFDLAAEFRH
jgi:hypothetical protein